MKKFIKAYWLQILLILSASSYLAIELANQEWTDVIFALAFVVTAVHSLLLRISYDDLREDHEELIMDFVNEFRTNPMPRELETLIVDSKPAKKRGRPKKDVKPVKAKRGRPRSTK